MRSLDYYLSIREHSQIKIDVEELDNLKLEQRDLRRKALETSATWFPYFRAYSLHPKVFSHCLLRRKIRLDQFLLNQFQRHEYKRFQLD